MADFVVYRQPNVSALMATRIGPVGIYTKREAFEAVGERVWLIAGEGKPRTFRLWSTFVVSEVTVSDKAAFATRIQGKEWQFPDPMPILNEEPWFKMFCRKQGNFALRFQAIDDCAVELGLRMVLKASGILEARASTQRTPTIGVDQPLGLLRPIRRTARGPYLGLSREK